MERTVHGMKKLTTFLAAALTCALAFSLWFTLYHYDNKYTAQGPKAIDGLLTLDNHSLAENPVVFLVDGWEYYHGARLTPADFNENPPIPDQYIFIGRFGGFEGTDKASPPHGSASYRLRISLPQETASYALELPEIFSAYRLYVNGVLTVSMGEADPAFYRPQTGNRVVNLEAGGDLELLLAVSDYSHLYSGMVYPPAFGRQAAVHNLLNARLVFRAALCAAALTVGLLSVLVSLLSRKKAPAMLYGLLCLLFVGYTCYPVTQTFFTGFQPKYALENVSFCAMLLVVLLLAQRLCRIKAVWSRSFLVFGGLMCLLAAAGPFLWHTGNLRIMTAYSFFISAYEWAVSLFLTAAAARGVWNNSVRAKPLLFGLLIFDTALAADRILPLHEPIVTGWFPELAGFMLIAAVGITIGQEIAGQYRKTAVLMERAESMAHLYRRQQTYYTVLKREMEESKKMRHDMRHHFTVMDGFVQSRQYEKLSDYAAQYKSAGPCGELPDYCPIDVINVLSHHYAALAGENGIHLDIRCSTEAAGEKAGAVRMSDADLCCLYSNLMENAIEACMRVKAEARTIRVAIARPDTDSLMIRIRNSTDGAVNTDGNSFLSSKEKGRQGYGLISIRSIAEKYHGSASFHWDKSKREFESKVLVSA